MNSTKKNSGYKSIISSSFRYDSTDDYDFKFLPNATIFRPGDTLKLTIIGYQRHKYQSSLLRNKDVTITYTLPREEEKDPVKLAEWQAHFDEQLRHITADTPDQRTSGKRKFYKRLDTFITAQIYDQLKAELAD